MMAAPQRELVALDHHKLAMHPIGHINPPYVRITRFVPPRWPAAAVQNSAVATPPRLRQRARRQLRPGKPSSDLRQKRMFRPGAVMNKHTAWPPARPKTGLPCSRQPE